MYSRWWGGWAVREAGTAGWTPRRSASSPSIASWTDPSWLRPLASWVTRGSVSDRPQLSRTGCERYKPSHTTNDCDKAWRKEKEGSSLLGARKSLGRALLRTDRCVSLWGESPELAFLNLTTVFDSRAMHYTRSLSPPPSPPLCAWYWARHQVRLQPLLWAWIGMLIHHNSAPPSLAAFRPIRHE